MNQFASLLLCFSLSGALLGCSGSTFSGSANTKKPAKSVQKPESKDVVEAEPDVESEGDLEEQEDEAPATPADEFEGEYACQKKQPGLVGKVYPLPVDTPKLPDFTAMTPVGQITTPQLAVAERDFESGFPGVPSLIEWFAVDFRAVLKLPQDGTYTFRLTSDDGSKLELDHDQLIDNDGVRPITTKDSVPVKLERGRKLLRVQWFQGPRNRIALQLFWLRPGSTTWELVPSTALEYGVDCDLPVIGDL